VVATADKQLARTIGSNRTSRTGQLVTTWEAAMSPDDSVDGIAAWDDIEDDGLLDASDTLDDDLVADPLDTGVAPPDRWAGVNRFGTTTAEARAGEPLDMRLAAEEPDPDPYAEPADDEDELTRRGYERESRAGRLASDDGYGAQGVETDLVAWDAGVDAGGASAEEAAIHIVEDREDAGEGPLR
jgi:Family of unknown function (DUF5709)